MSVDTTPINSMEEISKTYQFLEHKTQTEIRAIDPTQIKSGPDTCHVHFIDNETDFKEIFNKYDGKRQLYIGINERKIGGKYDKDVNIWRCGVLDIDVNKPPGTSSTDEQLAQSQEVMVKVVEWFKTMGFNKPSVGMSGNGYQIWFKMPPTVVTDDNRDMITQKIKAFETKIRDLFSTENINIDSIYNLSRIIKVIGSKSVKGDIHRRTYWDYYNNEEDNNLKQYILTLQEETKGSQPFKKTQNKNVDLSRSGQEWQKICTLIRSGLKKDNLDKEDILNRMMLFTKWSSEGEQYREHTWERALENCQVQAETKKTKKEDEDKIFVSFIETPEYLYEQVRLVDGTSKYLRFNIETEELTFVNSANVGGLMYEPITDEEVGKKIIGLPSGTEEYGSDKELDCDIDEFIKKFLDIDEAYRKFAIYNIRKSWVYEKFNTINYLRALGEYGTGKSRYLDTLGLLHYKPIATSGSLTAAVMFRLIEKWKGTLIIDEADRKSSDASDEVIKIINQGYEKNRSVIRCDKENGYALKFFDTYCPKILATRKEFEDKATESRCLTVVMKQTSRNEIPPNLNKEFHNELEHLRNKLLLWRFRNLCKINPEHGQEINLDFLEPRLRQVSVGFFSMFNNDKTAVDEFKEFLRNHQTEIVEQRSTTVEGRILTALAQIVVNNLQGCGTKNLTQEFLDTISFSNSKIVEQAALTSRQGGLWKPQKLCPIMKTLGFGKTISKRFDGEGVKRSYVLDLDYFKKMVGKYVSDLELISKIEPEIIVVEERVNEL